MRVKFLASLLGVSLFLAPVTYAQTAAVTATCKDGTTFTGATRAGACSGHQGVSSWGTPAAASPNAVTAPAAAAAAAAPATTATAGKSAAGAPAKGGGPGQVWVNSASKVYHCPGDRYYGKTKAGEYMTQAAAQAAGNHPSGGKACPT